MRDLLSLIARQYGGRVYRDQALIRGIGHGPGDLSVCVKLDPRAPGGILVNCFGSGDPIEEKKRIQALLGWGDAPQRSFTDKEPPLHPKPRDDAQRTAQAL